MMYNKDIVVSLIYILSEEASCNAKTGSLLKLQDIAADKVELIICSEDKSLTDDAAAQFAKWPNVRISESYDINAVGDVNGHFVTVIKAGSSFGPSYLSSMVKYLESVHGYKLAIPAKKHEGEDVNDVFSRIKSTLPYLEINFNTQYNCLPYFLEGTWIDSSYWKNGPLRTDIRYETEKAFLFDIMLKEMKMLYVNEQIYEFHEASEDSTVFFEGYYQAEWYYEAIDKFWVPYLESMNGKVPAIIQTQAIYALNNRVEANLNNLNKHCVPIEEAEDYLWSWSKVLKHIDDEIIMNSHNLAFCGKKFYVQELFMKIKYHDESYRLSRYYLNGKPYYGAAGVLAASGISQKVNIQFMDYRDGKLAIDGTLSGIYDIEEGHFYVETENGIIEVEKRERYSHTKLFGISFYKRISFRVVIPVENVERQSIAFKYSVGEWEDLLRISFDSHTSCLSGKFKNSYWTFGENYMAAYKFSTIVIYKIRKRSVFKREMKLWFEMLMSRKLETYKFLLVRMAYFICKPFMKRKPVWMFIDKIYKAGDSSEYIFKYASAQNDGIKKYYLVDKKCPDCKRLKAEGYKPLIRRSIKHRLIFLYADMMVISNSTVFAFNDYSMSASAHVRDLIHFHVACVQHGMSIQKIAIAQNRLRDNTRLYFCASKYEIENLSRPVYDYAGFNALKLTGVPRYDGLINDDKRQILITPTWRMQASVPVTRNEGVARDYNPLFKETDYYRIYNSLINDTRLLDAARKYNYRIAYVLHPIVSPQVDDFDKNDYVDIIPSTGDMSYEKVFRESSLMVTDYSGVQFDFAYMRKPLVYLHHDDIPQHYEEGTYHYDTMAFGEICHNNDELIDTLIDYMKNNCVMKDEYRARADDFFEFSDHNNCKRIYDVMIDYQKNVIE